MGGGHLSRPDFGMPQPDPAHPLTEFYLLLQHGLDRVPYAPLLKKAKIGKALILNRIRAFLIVCDEVKYSISMKYVRGKFRVFLGGHIKSPQYTLYFIDFHCFV